MKYKNIALAVLVVGAAFAAYKILFKSKKKKVIEDRGFEIEIETEE